MPQKEPPPAGSQPTRGHDATAIQPGTAATDLTPAALLASARALRAQADVLEALAAAQTPDELLSGRDTLKTYGVGIDGLKAAAGRGELELVRGPHQKLLVRRSVLERWLESRPYKPRPARKAEPTPDLDAWTNSLDQELARAKRAGGRRG